VPPISLTHPRLAEWSVNGFFAISGYLIAGSRLRLGWWAFLERRARRLLPAFWVVLVVVAFGFAPIVAMLTEEHWRAPSALGYVMRNAGLYIVQRDIDDTLTGTPYGDTQWNGPLWTLFYEACCYVGFGMLLGWRVVRRNGTVVAAMVLVVLMALQPVLITDEHDPWLRAAVRLSSFFAAGVLCWFLRERIPVRWWVPALSSAVVVAISLISDGQWYAQLPAAIFFLSLGSLLPIRVGANNDISYGIYIYGWPVQKSISNVGYPPFGVYGFFALSILLTVPLAWASWKLVEQRFLPRRRPRQDEIPPDDQSWSTACEARPPHPRR
jgi:peptidoglycan/LPS O-acetylase OafA/YrhL